MKDKDKDKEQDKVRDFKVLQGNKAPLGIDKPLMEEAAKALVEVIPIIAGMHKSYYDALVKEGFSREEAIILVGQHGTSCGVYME
jgi:hypothetical protein